MVTVTRAVPPALAVRARGSRLAARGSLIMGKRATVVGLVAPLPMINSASAGGGSANRDDLRGAHPGRIGGVVVQLVLRLSFGRDPGQVVLHLEPHVRVVPAQDGGD